MAFGHDEEVVIPSKKAVMVKIHIEYSMTGARLWSESGRSGSHETRRHLRLHHGRGLHNPQWRTQGSGRPCRTVGKAFYDDRILPSKGHP